MFFVLAVLATVPVLLGAVRIALSLTLELCFGLNRDFGCVTNYWGYSGHT